MMTRVRTAIRFFPPFQIHCQILCQVLCLTLYLVLCPTFCLADPQWDGYGNRGDGNPTAVSAVVPAVDSTAPKFYLLRTGFLMEGMAATEGKNYVIRTDFGTIHVPVTNVEFVGQDKQDIYRYKKGSVDAANCNELMKFAEWCLSHGLKSEGVSEYERALKVAPNPTLTEVIRQRLRTASMAATDAVEATDMESELENRGLSGAAPPDRGTESELERWVAGLPKSVVEQYVKKVQQTLLVGCAAADCHGTNSANRFKIAKPRQLIGATTYGNLRAVLPWVNLDYPTDSAILTAMVTYHGGAKPEYSVESRQYDNVIQWIQLAAKELPLDYHNAAGKAGNDGKNTAAESEKTLPKNEAPTNSTLLPPGFRDVGKRDSEAATPVAAPTPNTREQTREQSQEKPQEDPFDPSVFNARYHSKH